MSQDEQIRSQMKKEAVVDLLKEQGCRITKQRLLLLDIILSGDCSCCKEIYYRAVEKDPKIGTATVYRMINTLEMIGAISRKNFYKIGLDSKEDEAINGCRIEFENHTAIELRNGNLKKVIQTGLAACGYKGQEPIKNLIPVYGE